MLKKIITATIEASSITTKTQETEYICIYNIYFYMYSGFLHSYLYLRYDILCIYTTCISHDIHIYTCTSVHMLHAVHTHVHA